MRSPCCKNPQKQSTQSSSQIALSGSQHKEQPSFRSLCLEGSSPTQLSAQRDVLAIRQMQPLTHGETGTQTRRDGPAHRDRRPPRPDASGGPTLTSSSSLSLGFSSDVCLTKSGMRISSVARAAGRSTR